MKLILEAGDLSAALSKAVGIVERTSTIPILANVLLEAEGETLRLTTTDLERRVTLALDGDVGEPGAVTVNAHKLAAIASKAVHGSQIKLALSKTDHLSVAAGAAKYKLGTLPAADYPLPHSPKDDGVEFTIPGSDLEQMFGLTRYSILTEGERDYLKGTYLDTLEVDGDPYLISVATDGHRLSRFYLPAPSELAEAGKFEGVIVPRKTVFTLGRLLKDCGDPVTVTVREATISFGIRGLRLESKLIYGQFPNWQRVVPARGEKSAKVNVADFAEAVERAVIVGSRSSKLPTGIRLTIKDQAISVSANNREAGDSGSDVFEALAVDGEGFEVGLNGRYLSDMLANWGSNQVDIRIADPSSPVLFLPPDCAGSTSAAGQLSVIMPMRL